MQLSFVSLLCSRGWDGDGDGGNDAYAVVGFLFLKITTSHLALVYIHGSNLPTHT